MSRLTKSYHNVTSQHHVTTPRHNVTSHHIPSPRLITTPCHVMSCLATSHGMSHHVVSPRFITTPCPIKMSLDHITPKCHVTSCHVSSHHRRVTTPRHKLKSRCLDTQLSSQRLITTTRYNVSSHRHVASCQVPSRLITSPRHVKFRHVSI